MAAVDLPSCNVKEHNTRLAELTHTESHLNICLTDGNHNDKNNNNNNEIKVSAGKQSLSFAGLKVIVVVVVVVVVVMVKAYIPTHCY